MPQSTCSPERLPHGVRGSIEFQSACPASAVAMKKDLVDQG